MPLDLDLSASVGTISKTITGTGKSTIPHTIPRLIVGTFPRSFLPAATRASLRVVSPHPLVRTEIPTRRKRLQTCA